MWIMRKIIRKGLVVMTKRTFADKMARNYRQGQVDALILAGHSISDIAELLELNESTVRSIHGISRCEEEEI